MISISLVGLRNKAFLEEVATKYSDVFFELSSAMTQEDLSSLYPIIKGRIKSIHCLCPNRTFCPNLASSKKSVIKKSIEVIKQDAELAHKVGVNVLTLHPGYMVDELVPSNAKDRIELMEKYIPASLISRKKGAICTQEYINSKVYYSFFSNMIENVSYLSDELLKEDINLAIENLNPRAGYLMIHPEEMLTFAKLTSTHFTLDIGHLWISSCFFGFNFLDAIIKICNTKRVSNTHLHSNKSIWGDITSLEDDHNDIDNSLYMPWKDAVRIINSSGSLLTLETLHNPFHNINVLKEFLGG